METAEKFAIEVTAELPCYIQPDWLSPIFLGFGIMDGVKGVAVWPTAHPERGQIVINYREPYFSNEGVTDWFSPNTYRLVVDKSHADPADYVVEVYVNGTLVLTVPYSALADAPETMPDLPYTPHLFAFGGAESGTVWYNVRYEVCGPTLEEQVEEIIDNIQDLLVYPATPQDALANLQKAEESLGEARVQLTEGEVKKAFTAFNKTITELIEAANKGAALATSVASADAGKLLAPLGKTAADIGVNVSAIINGLVTVTKLIVQEALADALPFAGDPKVDKEIEKAEKEMDKAQEELDQGNPDKAIKHFRKAWEHAQKAIKKGGGILAKGQTKFVKKQELDSSLKIPQEFLLEQNYPNPFNPETEIRFQLPKASHVVVRIFNTLGQEIRTLVDKTYQAGYHSVRWDSKNNHGTEVSSGVYLYQLQAGDFVEVKKMSLLR